MAISLKVKLAACLLLIARTPHEEAKTLNADQILGRFEWDHYPIRKVDGGPAAPWNLVPRLKEEHRQKTAKIDMPAIAKDRRIETKWAPFMTAVAKGIKPRKRMKPRKGTRRWK